MRHKKTLPTHPGKMLREIIIPASGLTKTAIAAGLGISRPTLYDLMREEAAVTPAMALRLGKFFGNGPELWLRMQANHDLAKARETLDVDAIKTIAAA